MRGVPSLSDRLKPVTKAAENISTSRKDIILRATLPGLHPQLSEVIIQTAQEKTPKPELQIQNISMLDLIAAIDDLSAKAKRLEDPTLERISDATALSLSFGIKDMISVVNNLQEQGYTLEQAISSVTESINGIIASTNLDTNDRQQVEQFKKKYQIYWKSDEPQDLEVGEEILDSLNQQGKIFQPRRIDNIVYPNIVTGYWVK